MELPDFSGPLGGALSGAFMAGAAFGWSLSQKTARKEIKRADREVKALRSRIERLEKRLTEVEDSRFEAMLKHDNATHTP